MNTQNNNNPQYSQYSHYQQQQQQQQQQKSEVSINSFTKQTKSITNIKDNQQSRKQIIMFQYKMMQMYGPLLGVYAIPNLDNYNVWNCIIFIRKGFYKDGKFKFDLIFPGNFPSQHPQIYFKSTVYHSLVKQNNGKVDINSLLNQKWKQSNDNMLYSLFSGLQKMFIQKQKMTIKTSCYPQAAYLLINKPQAFIQQALNSVEQSHLNLYVNQPGTSLVINQYNNGELDYLKNKLEDLCQENRAPQDKRNQFLKCILDQQ